MMLIRYKLYRLNIDSCDNAYLKRDIKSNTEECTVEVIQKILMTILSESMNSDGGHIIMDTPWVGAVDRSDTFGLKTLGVTLNSAVGYVGRTVPDFDRLLPPFLNPLRIADHLYRGESIGYLFYETLEAIQIGVAQTCTDASVNQDSKSNNHRMISEALEIFHNAQIAHANSKPDVASLDAGIEDEYLQRRTRFQGFLSEQIQKLESLQTDGGSVERIAVEDKTDVQELIDYEAVESQQNQTAKKKQIDRTSRRSNERNSRSRKGACSVNKRELAITNAASQISRDRAIAFLQWTRNKSKSQGKHDHQRRSFMMFAVSSLYRAVDKIQINTKELSRLVEEDPTLFEKLDITLMERNAQTDVVDDESSAHGSIQSSSTNNSEKENKRCGASKRKRKANQSSNGKRKKRNQIESQKDATITFNRNPTAVLLGDATLEILANVAIHSFKNGEFFSNLLELKSGQLRPLYNISPFVQLTHMPYQI